MLYTLFTQRAIKGSPSSTWVLKRHSNGTWALEAVLIGHSSSRALQGQLDTQSLKALGHLALEALEALYLAESSYNEQ